MRKNFKVGDRAVWRHNPGGSNGDEYVKTVSVTVVEIKDKTYVIQFEGTANTKSVPKDSKWLSRE